MPAEPRNGADEAFGYRFGIDGLMNVADTCTFLGGISDVTLLKLAEAGDVRKGQRCKGGRLYFCRRSVAEYAGSLER